jgi:hypothetical protein
LGPQWPEFAVRALYARAASARQAARAIRSTVAASRGHRLDNRFDRLDDHESRWVETAARVAGDARRRAAQTLIQALADVPQLDGQPLALPPTPTAPAAQRDEVLGQ